MAELRRIVIRLPIVRGNANLTAARRDRVLPALGGLGRCGRAGFVTESRRNRIADHLIARHTRHKTVAMLNVYDRPGELLSQPALAGEWW